MKIFFGFAEIYFACWHLTCPLIAHKCTWFFSSLSWACSSISATTNLEGSIFSFNSNDKTFLCTNGNFSWIFTTSCCVIWCCKLGFTNRSFIICKSTWSTYWITLCTLSLFFFVFSLLLLISICPSVSGITLPSSSIISSSTTERVLRQLIQTSFSCLSNFLHYTRFVSQTFKAISPFICSNCEKWAIPSTLIFCLHTMNSWNLDLTV